MSFLTLDGDSSDVEQGQSPRGPAALGWPTSLDYAIGLSGTAATLASS